MILILSAIIMIAGFLRFYRLSERGVIGWDDGNRMNEIRFLNDLIQFVRRHFRGILSKKINFEEECKKFSGVRLMDLNPFGTFIYYLAFLGTKNIENCGLFSNAVFGVLGILGTFFAGSVLFNQTVGLWAAFILAWSGYHLLYSRAIHKEVISGAFYIWGTAIYYLSLTQSNIPLLLLSGILVGCAFASNFRNIHFPFMFLSYEIIGWFYFPFSWGMMLTRLTVMGVGMALSLFLIEEIFVILHELGYPYPSYFKQIYHATGNVAGIDLKLPFLKMYLLVLNELEGPIILFCVLIGMVNLFSHFNMPAFIVLSQFLAPLIYWSARPPAKPNSTNYNIAGPRFISSCIYAIALIASVALSFISGHPFIYIMIGALAILGVYHSRKVIAMRSGYKHAIQFMNHNGNGKHFSFCYPVSSFYLPKEQVWSPEILENESEILRIYKNENVRYLLYVPFIHQEVYPNLNSSVLEKILKTLKPIYTIGHGISQLKSVYVEETQCYFKRGWKSIDLALASKIEVYDLAPLFEPMTKR